MKRIIICLLILFLSAGTVYALPVTLTDVTGFTATGTDPPEDYFAHRVGDVNRLDYFNDYVKWTHHFDLDPYTEIYSGTLTLALRDDGGWLDGPELGFGWTEGGTWDFGEVDTGEYSYDVNVAFLEDGEFNISLASLGGDFFIGSSTLTINYETVNSTAPVPEPATMLLLGSGIIGLAGFGRCRRKS